MASHTINRAGGYETIMEKTVWELDVKYAGETRSSKITRVRQLMAKEGTKEQAVSNLEDIAWILNLRGNYEEHRPVFLSYLIIDSENATLFGKRADFSDNLIKCLFEEGINFEEYDEKADYAKELQREEPYDEIGPMALFKAIKNDIEIDNFKKVNIKDGVAMVKLLYWLQENAAKEEITEFDVADKIIELRSVNEDYLGESFPAIIGYQEHGVIIHYHATEATNAIIKAKGMLLIDTGGHYLSGTTDTTRTITLSEPTEAQKRHYTAVLKGNLNLGNTKFHQGTLGIELDELARRPVQDIGLDYAHGTGHGVGYVLNVHEGPQRITKQGKNANEVPLQAGMITSNEPGVYIEDEYGIRLENVTLCRGVDGDEQVLEFETLTMVPFDINLINASELTDTQKQCLNEYHENVYQTLLPHLGKEEGEWLAKITAKV